MKIFEDDQQVYCVNHPHYPDFRGRVIGASQDELELYRYSYLVAGGIGKVTVVEPYLSAVKPITLSNSMIDDITVRPAFAALHSPMSFDLCVQIKSPVDTFYSFAKYRYMSSEPFMDGRQRSQLLQLGHGNEPVAVFRGPLGALQLNSQFMVMSVEDGNQLRRSKALRLQQAFIYDVKHKGPLLIRKIASELENAAYCRAIKQAIDVAVAQEFRVGPRTCKM
jgi:hypothetical protein